MAHKTDTQSCPVPMPRESFLLRRDGHYYLNRRVPTELRPLYGKTEFIRKSLKTWQSGALSASAGRAIPKAQSRMQRRVFPTSKSEAPFSARPLPFGNTCSSFRPTQRTPLVSVRALCAIRASGEGATPRICCSRAVSVTARAEFKHPLYGGIAFLR